MTIGGVVTAELAASTGCNVFRFRPVPLTAALLIRGSHGSFVTRNRGTGCAEVRLAAGNQPTCNS